MTCVSQFTNSWIIHMCMSSPTILSLTCSTCPLLHLLWPYTLVINSTVHRLGVGETVVVGEQVALRILPPFLFNISFCLSCTAQTFILLYQCLFTVVLAWVIVTGRWVELPRYLSMYATVVALPAKQKLSCALPEEHKFSYCHSFACPCVPKVPNRFPVPSFHGINYTKFQNIQLTSTVCKEKSLLHSSGMLDTCPRTST